MGFDVMGICAACCRNPLPFAMAALITGVLTLITWMLLDFSQPDPLVRTVGTAVVGVAVGATLLHYLLSCLKRHCRHRPRERIEAAR